MATHSSILAWRIPGMGELGGLPSMGSHRIGHDWGDLAAAVANYGGGHEDNGDLLPKTPCMYCYTQCPHPCSRPPPTHASAGDSWTLTGKSGSVSGGVTAPFSCVLVHTRFCLCPPKVYFPENRFKNKNVTKDKEKYLLYFRYLDWKGRSRAIFVCRCHDSVYRKS